MLDIAPPTPPTPAENTLGELSNLLKVGLASRLNTFQSLWVAFWGDVQQVATTTDVTADDGSVTTSTTYTPDPSQRKNVFGLSPVEVAAALGTDALKLFSLGSAETAALPAQAAIVGRTLTADDTPGVPTGWTVTPVLGQDGQTPTGAVTISYAAPAQ